MRRSLLTLAAASFAAACCLAPRASATSVVIESTLLADFGAAGRLFLLELDVTDLAVDAGAGFDVLFDPELYAGLAFPAAPGADWDLLLLQPDPSLPADGLFDALALSDSAPLGIFSLEALYLGPGAPPPLRFEVYDSDFQVIESGMTVPEPAPAAFLMLGLLGLAALRRIRRTPRPRSGALSALLLAAFAATACDLTGDVTDPHDGAPQPLAAPAPPAGAVVHETRIGSATLRYYQVASRRVSRTLFEYDFAGIIENGASVALDLSLSVSSVAGATTVSDPAMAFGMVGPGESADSQGDVFRIVQDRTFPFDPADLLFYVEPTTATGLCREALFVARDVVAADEHCQAAVAADPTDPEARFFRAVTRLLRIAEEQIDGPDPSTFSDSVKEMMDQAGIEPASRSIYAFDAGFPRNVLGQVELPADAPTGDEIQRSIDEVAMIAAIEASIADLRGIGSAAVLILGHADLDLLGDVAGASLRADSIEIDQGDVQALIAALAFVAGKLRLSRSADASLDVDALSPFQGTLVQAILDADPLLGASLTDTAPLREDARAAFAEAAAAYLAASEAIRAETDDQGDDLLTIEPDTESEESEVRTKVGQAMVALDPALPTQQTLYDEGSCFIDEARARAFLNRKLGTGIGANGAIVDLAVIFAGLGGTPFDVRAHAPDFESDNGIRDADAPAGNAFPDPTFSGALAPALSPPPVGSPGPCP